MTDEEIRARLLDKRDQAQRELDQFDSKRQIDILLAANREAVAAHNDRIEHLAERARTYRAEIAVRDFSCACGAPQGSPCDLSDPVGGTHVGRAYGVSQEAVEALLRERHPALIAYVENFNKDPRTT